MPEFKDYFSHQSENYAKYRPVYPENLFKYLAELSPAAGTALDCAAGTGQAASGLVKYFDSVIALDASHNQVSSRTCLENVSYVLGKAESLCITSKSVDLVVIAQALHWIDLEKFYNEVRRILKKDGLIAAWTYNLPRYNAVLNRIIDRFYADIVGKYWAPERKHIEDNYASMEFPFDRLETPDFNMTTEWTAIQLVGYISTWSAVRKYIDAVGNSPIPELADQVQEAWQDLPETVTFNWPFKLLAGRCR